jgi:hypothetical protein
MLTAAGRRALGLRMTGVLVPEPVDAELGPGVLAALEREGVALHSFNSRRLLAGGGTGTSTDTAALEEAHRALLSTATMEALSLHLSSLSAEAEAAVGRLVHTLEGYDYM